MSTTNGTYNEAQADTVPLGEPVYTVKEAAAYLDLGTSRVDTLTYKGVLKSYAQDIGTVLLQRDVHALKGVLKSYAQDIGTVLLQRMEAAGTTPTEMPVDVPEPEPRAALLTKLDEVAALNTVITKVFAEVSLPATLTKLEEVPPMMRMWKVEVQTLTGMKRYRVLFDGEAFSVSENREVPTP